ncbi:hypothetical protein HPB52_023156 [Rhipicephalus sanguineus]|uniref:Uncharacterized protein n=1 Tax=Rhipicephalus sanguineus TaxID=34632 RepID=A0A9D4PY01_RHISA|nr:hypothetical protein HPB52_023156 [Rhipicephalus sanguineus]
MTRERNIASNTGDAVEEPVSGQTKLFTFTVVFEPEATQEDVFEHCGIKRLIDMALDGIAYPSWVDWVGVKSEAQR